MKPAVYSGQRLGLWGVGSGIILSWGSPAVGQYCGA